MTVDCCADIENVETVDVTDLVGRAHRMADRRMRFVTCTCLDCVDHFDIFYHFDEDTALQNLLVRLPKGEALPSITPAFFCAFLAENELQSLFGIKVDGLGIDYGGKLLVVDDGAPPPLLKSTT